MTASTLRLYVNGTQVASTAHTGSITTSTNPLQIGGDSIYGQFFAGLIDERPRLQRRAYRRADPNRRGHRRSTLGPDTTPPTQPGTLTATAVSGSEVDLSWGASTDNVGVTGYDVERCQGASCTNFAQIGTATGTTLQGHQRQRLHQLQLSRTRDRRCRQPQPLLEHRQRHHPDARHDPADAAREPDARTSSRAARVDLSWGASTDNVGVTAYLIERCTGAGCGKPVNGQPSPNFKQIATVAGTSTSYKDTRVSPSTTYSYQVRATDAAGNLSPYTNVADATTPAGPSGLVAAYGFDEGSGTTVTDASGNGNNGTITNATWATSGKYGKALQFNGTSSLVTIPDSASLHLTTGMTLEAWVNPSTVNGTWRDVIYKGNDNFYLEGDLNDASSPDAGMIAGGTLRRRLRHLRAARQHLVLPHRDLRRVDAAPLRQRNAGCVDRPHRQYLDLDQPAADRRRQHLRPVLRRPDRRSPHLQHRPYRRPDPNRRRNIRSAHRRPPEL